MRKNMAKFFTFGVWLLVFAIVVSIIAISPNPYASGVEIKSVNANSLAADNGLRQDLKILKVNNEPIKTVADYTKAISYLEKKPVELLIETDKARIKINVTNKIKISLD